MVHPKKYVTSLTIREQRFLDPSSFRYHFLGKLRYRSRHILSQYLIPFMSRSLSSRPATLYQFTFDHPNRTYHCRQCMSRHLPITSRPTTSPDHVIHYVIFITEILIEITKINPTVYCILFQSNLTDCMKSFFYPSCLLVTIFTDFTLIAFVNNTFQHFPSLKNRKILRSTVPFHCSFSVVTQNTICCRRLTISFCTRFIRFAHCKLHQFYVLFSPVAIKSSSPIAGPPSSAFQISSYPLSLSKKVPS